MKRLILLLLVSLTFLNVNGSDTLIVGVKNSPPFTMRGSDGNWTGLCIDIMDEIEDRTQKTIVYQEVNETYSEIPKLLENGNINLFVGSMTITADRLKKVSFTQPYYVSGISIATNIKQETNFFDTLFGWSFWNGIIMLLITIFLSGFIFWLFERGSGNTNFNDSWMGIFDGAYFASFTMTTVGYGDVLKTKGGKIMAILLMWISIGLVGYMYGQITTALTVTKLGSNIANLQELRKTKIGTIEGSTSAIFLDRNNVKYIGFKTTEEALDAINNNELTTFVYDTPILKYFIGKDKYKDINLIDQAFSQETYGFASKNGDDVIDELDPIIKALIDSEGWNDTLSKYKLK